MGAIHIIYGSTADTFITVFNATYLTARASTGSTGTGVTNSQLGIGNDWTGSTYGCAQAFLVFDTSTVPAGSGTGYFSVNVDTFLGNHNADTLRFRQVSVITSKIAGASLSAQTPLWSDPGTFPTGTGVYTANIASVYTLPRSATFNVLVHTVGEQNATVPTARTRFTINSADATGTTNDPFLRLDVGPVWEFVGVSNVVEVTAASHALVTTGISGTLQAGDLLVACISSRIASTTSVTLPTGGAWTLVGEQKANNIASNTTATPSALMAYAIRGASNPNLTFTHPTAPSVALGRIIAYRNVNQSSPLDTQSAATTATAQTAVSVAGLTTTQADDLIVALTAGGQEAAWSAFNATDPIGASSTASQTGAPTTTWLERADSLTTTGVDTSLAIFDAVKTSVGATGNFTATASVSAAHSVIAGAFKIYVDPYVSGAGSAPGVGTASAVGDTGGPATTDAVGDADGVGTAAATSEATKETIGTAAGIATAAAGGSQLATVAGTGNATSTATSTGIAVTINTGDGTAAGIGSASAEGASFATVAGDGSAAGVGTAAATGAQIAGAAGDADGIGTATAATHIVLTTAATAAGVGTATAGGAQTATSTASAAGAGAASATGEQVRPSIGTAPGVGSATAEGAISDASVSATGTAAGVGTAAAVGSTGSTAAEATGAASGVGTATATGAQTAASTGLAAGLGSATALSVAGAIVSGAGTAAGVGTASATGVTLATSQGSASGVGTAAATGVKTATASGTAAGIGAATASGAKTAVASGAAAGTGAAAATGITIATVAGSANGIGATAAVGFEAEVVFNEGAGTAAGAGSTSGIGFGIQPSATPGERVAEVPFNSRAGSVPGSTRTAAVAASGRTAAVPAHDRIAVVPRLDRAA